MIGFEYPVKKTDEDMAAEFFSRAPKYRTKKNLAQLFANHRETHRVEFAYLPTPTHEVIQAYATKLTEVLKENQQLKKEI